MWSYYGSKGRIVGLYPKPIYSEIVEAFAGSARYSLMHFEKDVTLYDKYDVIIGIWRWLQKASIKDVLSLRHPGVGNLINPEMFDCIEQYRLMGFLISRVQRTPARTVTSFGEMRFESDKKRIAHSLFKIRHWKFEVSDYINISNRPATWFSDAPYQYGGHTYKHSNKNIDFRNLANWCASRQRQSIVCENTKADWMLFMPMKEMNGIKHKTTEAIWSNMTTAFDFQQGVLF